LFYWKLFCNKGKWTLSSKQRRVSILVLLEAVLQ
jgi:hypothetical protein